jgi:dihydroflavonol-4-reductase
VAAARERRVPRLVHASTSGTIALSRVSEVLDESHAPPRALIGAWPYYRSKLYAEELALEANGDGLAVVSVNPSLLLGSGDERGSSTVVVAQALSGDLALVPTGGLSFVDARDVATAMLAAMLRGRAGARYLLGACNLTWREFFGRIERLSGRPAPKLPLPLSPTLARLGTELLAGALWGRSLPPPVTPVELEMAQHFWYLDSGLAERELAFAPRDPNATLRDTIDDLRARGPLQGSRQGRARPPEGVA